MPLAIADARPYVEALRFPDDVEARLRRAPRGADDAEEMLASSARQAAVVGSEIVGFVQGVSPRRRRAIVRSSLLAQLAAKRRVPRMEDFDAWYDASFEVLEHIGWSIQRRDLAIYRAQSQDFRAHEAILSIAEALFGHAAPAALELRHWSYFVSRSTPSSR